MEERRREPRRAASGTVTLTAPDGSKITATLLDTSASGFRAEYTQPGIRSGTELRVTAPSGDSRVRVAWTLTVGGKSQSGFYRVD